MAEKKKKPKARPQSAAEKEANSNLTRAKQAALALQASRVKAATRGAFGARKLRAGGTEMQQYALDRFSNDPFPTPTDGPPSAPRSPSTARRSGGGARDGASAAEKRARVRQQRKAKEGNERRDNIRGPINTEKREDAERIARERAEAERKAKIAARKKKLNSRSTKKGAGGNVYS